MRRIKCSKGMTARCPSTRARSHFAETYKKKIKRYKRRTNSKKQKQNKAPD